MGTFASGRDFAAGNLLGVMRQDCGVSVPSPPPSVSCSGCDSVKSPRSSYTGLYPQKFGFPAARERQGCEVRLHNL